VSGRSFLEEEAQLLTRLSDFIKPISMQVESVYHQEQYDIVLVSKRGRTDSR
jgi:ribonuclease G